MVIAGMSLQCWFLHGFSPIFSVKKLKQSQTWWYDVRPHRFPPLWLLSSLPDPSPVDLSPRPNTWRETFACPRPWSPCPCRPLVGWGCGVGTFPKGGLKKLQTDGRRLLFGWEMESLWKFWVAKSRGIRCNLSTKFGYPASFWKNWFQLLKRSMSSCGSGYIQES